MSLPEKVKHELKAIALTTLYFAVWLGVLVFLKRLVLADYQIRFRGFSVAIVGALVIAKVVLVMEQVPLGAWVRTQPAALDVVLRTVLYGVGVAVALLLEKAFEARKEYGGFGNALLGVFHHRDIRHVWANTICLVCALLVFNALSVLRRHLGDRELAGVFFSPALGESKQALSETGQRERAGEERTGNQ
jgi:hypothetical protein